MASQREELLEQLCRQGCSEVREYIESLRQGGAPPGAGELSQESRQWLLGELEAIMRVYDGD